MAIILILRKKEINTALCNFGHIKTYFTKNQKINDWHIVYTKPRQERRAALNLSRQGFEIFLPMICKEVSRKNSLDMVEEPLFKCYLFFALKKKAHGMPNKYLGGCPIL